MGQRRPYIDFQEVKQKISIPDAFDVLGILDQFTEKNGVYTGACPIPTHIHGPQPNTQGFKFDNKRGLWLFKCWGDCNAGGDVVEAVKLIAQLSDEHVRFWFAEHFGDRLSTKKPKGHPVNPPEPKPEAKLTATGTPERSELQPLSFYLNLDGSAAYLRERHVSAETIERYGIGLCSKGVMNGYIAIPIYRYPKQDASENPLAYIGRWAGDDFDADAGRPRYKLPDGFPVSRIVFGLEQAVASCHRTDQCLIVTEGPFKVFYLADHGYPNTVSTLTASVSEDQAAILAATKRPIVLLLDGNDAGYEGARKAAARLITQTYVRVVKLPEGVEPDDLSAEQLDEVLAFAKP